MPPTSFGPIERLVVDPTICETCPNWASRNGHKVHFGALKAVLVRGALRQPLVIAAFTAGWIGASIVAAVLTFAR